MSIAHKEARESVYWLELLMRAEVAPAGRLADLAEETHELVKILSSILLTAKQRSDA